ncbi:helix-turn-helix domain-containing protein [Winogradskyella luteola]|uniref:Helix-turn-helix transcriptional regulator n=1 Tax=Winogradskyella luteola TaxID=2828330 RepID=A0A9X1FA30_9FLAO|nr:helix-turn-helix transcriptional regulator [Winogradskyella luteola]MBV7270076.1 helix-turn-helix transcriptional regulator [Winogradskyella luteola]
MADAIKAKRLDLKLTKVELAKILEVSPLTISTWENINKQPVPRMMKKIIVWLGYVPHLDVDMSTLGGQLYIYRCKHGLTQKDIAIELQIDRWAVTKVEKGIEIETNHINKLRRLIGFDLHNQRSKK